MVLATGAIERPLVFPGNDRPGILLASAAHTYLNRYGVRVGTRAVIVTSGDDAYQAALDLKNAGVDIAAIADLRSEASGALPAAARRAGIDVLPGSTVLGTEGEFDLVGFLRMLDDRGVTAPISVEVMSTELAALPPPEVAKRVFEAASSTVAQARAPR